MQHLQQATNKDSQCFCLKQEIKVYQYIEAEEMQFPFRFSKICHDATGLCVVSITGVASAWVTFRIFSEREKSDKCKGYLEFKFWPF